MRLNVALLISAMKHDIGPLLSAITKAIYQCKAKHLKKAAVPSADSIFIFGKFS